MIKATERDMRKNNEKINEVKRDQDATNNEMRNKTQEIN